jgi:hypothetical protein
MKIKSFDYDYYSPNQAAAEHVFNLNLQGAVPKCVSSLIEKKNVVL